MNVGFCYHTLSGAAKAFPEQPILFNAQIQRPDVVPTSWILGDCREAMLSPVP